MKRCKKCLKVKAIEDFENSKTKSGYGANCQECHKEYFRDLAKEYYRNNPEKFKKRNRDSYKARPDHWNELRKIRNRKLKLKVFMLVGGGKLQCVCCGERIFEFLCVDHINGGGLRERNDNNVKSGDQFYRFVLKQNNIKDRYQILCHNCNMAKGFYGRCPHYKLKRTIK